MTPLQALAALDLWLAEFGSPVILRRVTWLDGVAVPADVEMPAMVRGYQPHELTGSTVQGDSSVLLSPTPIIKAGWPGVPSADGTDVRVPVRGDKLVIAGRVRNIEAAAPIYVAGELVRIELQVSG
ncbi:hypothetical protein MWN34_18940 [Ancylobacter sp. 6x-1]|uniref:Uncharacterized protein n=1 Tax=Ancylobacter crimeensis TaxID=2579147 RepID=A0ABT0DGH1_9HYPH|nr:hypothetical protein [Ancylobacter crimeensis]MCK0198979.1 hypothetical protein [Ancylobacter crimeensis]